MTPPAVSVVMPTYRRLDFLPQALESVLAQSYRDFEVVVTDNSASTTVEQLVLGYGDPRVRYRHNGGNIGLQPNMMAGYAAARGELLATIHDDDVWEPDFLAELVPPLLGNADVSIAFCDYTVMDQRGQPDVVATDHHSSVEGRDRLRPGLQQDSLRLAIVDQSIQVSYAAVFRRDVPLGLVPIDLAPLYDLWIAYLATVSGGKAWYSPRRLTRYRHHDGSATAANPFHPQEIESFRRFLADRRTATLAPELRGKAARAEFRQGMHLFFEGQDVRAARAVLLSSVRSSPTPRSAASLAATFLPGGRQALGWARAREHRRSLTVAGR